MSWSTAARVRGLRCSSTCPISRVRAFFASASARGTGGNCLGEVVPFSGKRVDARVYLYAERTAGKGLDLATLAS
jgi:hypothetical protein